MSDLFDAPEVAERSLVISISLDQSTKRKLELIKERENRGSLSNTALNIINDYYKRMTEFDNQEGNLNGI